MIKISKRLKIIADYIEDNSRVVDIGCDHGLLGIYLLENKKNIKVIASDVNQNALNNAIKNIRKYKMQNAITTVLSNGLDNIDVCDVDTIVISGMGSHTIVGILYNNLKKLKNINTLILQSNNDLDFLRNKVTKIGYYICDENLVVDQGKIYTVIKFKKGYKFYTKKQLYFGPSLLKKKDKLFWEKNQLELLKLEKIYPLIPVRHYQHKIKTYFKIKLLKKMINN